MSRLITPEATAYFVRVIEPNDKGKYEITLVFPQDADLTELRAAAAKAALDKWGKEKVAKLQKQGKLRNPFRSGEDSDHFPDDTVRIATRSTRQPRVVSRIPGPDGKPTRLPYDPEVIYSGMVVHASVEAFAYHHEEGGYGVSFGLGNIQKIRDGERLSGGPEAEDEFAADPNAVADLSDLEDTGDANVDTVAVGAADPLTEMFST